MNPRPALTVTELLDALAEAASVDDVVTVGVRAIESGHRLAPVTCTGCQNTKRILTMLALVAHVRRRLAAGQQHSRASLAVL
jgi:hypothetical protein